MKLAAASKAGVLDGPLPLIQGGQGFIYRYPIVVDGRYWGMVSTVIDTDAFFRAAFQSLQHAHFGVAIRSSETHGVFYGDARLFSHPQVFLQESTVPNGRWQWAIAPLPHQATDSVVGAWLQLLLSLLVAGLVYFFAMERYRLSADAMLDSLTGCPNRRLLLHRLNACYDQASREQRTFGLMVLDIDHFKAINDQYGHDVGDAVIKAVAERLRRNVREEDTVSRIGGDEFVLLLPNLPSSTALEAIAQQLLSVFRLPVAVHGRRLPVQVSLGITCYDPQAPVPYPQLLKQADIALYQAKQTGRNRAVRWQATSAGAG